MDPTLEPGAMPSSGKMTTQLEPTLYLASKSSRRRELLEQIGVKVAVVSVDVPELREQGELPAQYVQRLAYDKAQTGADAVSGFDRPLPCLGSDTIVVIENQVLEKPKDQADGVAMLLALSGKTHQVMTAVSVATQAKQGMRLSITDVTFRHISESEAVAYWQSGEPADKAGGYGIQGLGAVFVRELKGSYTGVVGLPLYETKALLDEFNVPVWQLL